MGFLIYNKDVKLALLKIAIKDAILDGIIPNEHDAAYNFMIEKPRKWVSSARMNWKLTHFASGVNVIKWCYLKPKRW